jgi:hypothetical protein
VAAPSAASARQRRPEEELEFEKETKEDEAVQYRKMSERAGEPWAVQLDAWARLESGASPASELPGPRRWKVAGPAD